jgi:hypothetical protein
MISELGETILLAFGDLLLINHKYQYAILALEGACASYKLRTNTDFHSMNRRIAEICSEHEDWDRAVTYYEKILRQSKTENNINEVIKDFSIVHLKLL